MLRTEAVEDVPRPVEAVIALLDAEGDVGSAALAVRTLKYCEQRVALLIIEPESTAEVIIGIAAKAVDEDDRAARVLVPEIKP